MAPLQPATSLLSSSLSLTLACASPCVALLHLYCAVDKVSGGGRLMRVAGQDYLHEGGSAMQRHFRRNPVCPSGVLLTDTANAYWHVWRPAVRGQKRGGCGVPRRRWATAAPRPQVLSTRPQVVGTTNCSSICTGPPLLRAFGLCCILMSCGDLWMVAVEAMWLVHCVTACHAVWHDGSGMLLCLVL
jgi:hypothetical protein